MPQIYVSYSQTRRVQMKQGILTSHTLIILLQNNKYYNNNNNFTQFPSRFEDMNVYSLHFLLNTNAQQ
jgi:hypothetical protein